METLLSIIGQPGRREFGGEWIHVYGSESLCCPPVTITTLLSAVLQCKVKGLHFFFFLKGSLQQEKTNEYMLFGRRVLPICSTTLDESFKVSTKLNSQPFVSVDSINQG